MGLMLDSQPTTEHHLFKVAVSFSLSLSLSLSVWKWQSDTHSLSLSPSVWKWHSQKSTMLVASLSQNHIFWVSSSHISETCLAPFWVLEEGGENLGFEFPVGSLRRKYLKDSRDNERNKTNFHSKAMSELMGKQVCSPPHWNLISFKLSERSSEKCTKVYLLRQAFLLLQQTTSKKATLRQRKKIALDHHAVELKKGSGHKQS